jgi:hypothetical protein
MFENPSPDFLDEFFIQITPDKSPVTITWPSYIKWADAPLNTLDVDCTYQISIIDNLATYLKFS